MPVSNKKPTNPIEWLRVRVLIPIRQLLFALLQGLMLGDQKWARFRLVFAVLFSFALVFFLFTLVDLIDISGPGPSLLERLINFLVDILKAIRDLVSRFVDWVWPWINDNKSRFRYFLSIFIAALFVILYGARYIQDVYELKDYKNALRYFLASMFGFTRYAVLRVEAGKPQVAANEENTLLKIGGPGYVVIAPGNVVLFERLTGPASVRPAGKHFVTRFERIADIVNLDEQLGKSSHKATTRDGIPVEARDVTFRYRILPGKRFSGPAGRAMIDPYPFSNKAIIDRAYNRNVRGDGLMLWEAAVTLVIDTALTNYISANTLDKLISPSLIGGDVSDVTRELVQKSLFSPSTRNSLRSLGVELLFCDIGHFAINDSQLELVVQSLRTTTWKARWMGIANKTRSDAEARRQAFQELARAEVQAEMLMSIARALEDAGLKKDGTSLDNMDNIILMRTAQIIEAIGEPIQKDS